MRTRRAELPTVVARIISYETFQEEGTYLIVSLESSSVLVLQGSWQSRVVNCVGEAVGAL